MTLGSFAGRRMAILNPVPKNKFSGNPFVPRERHDTPQITVRFVRRLKIV